MIKVITEWRDFDSLKDDWEALLRQSDADNIFLTWEWINCWQKAQEAPLKPYIIVIQEDLKPIAIAPFYMQMYRLVNLVTYKALRCLGDKNSGAEYANFIVKAERSDELKTLLWGSLLSPERKDDWDFIWFSNISAWTKGGETLLQSLANVKKLHSHRRKVEFAQTYLNAWPTDFLPKLSKSLRTNIRQTSRRLDKTGPWKIVVSDMVDDISETLEMLFQLHNKHWANAGGGTFQRRPELVDFYRHFVPLALKKGWLWLLRLESQGEIQAMQLGYVYNNQFLAIQEGYNPDFIPGIGQVLRHYSFNQCLREGLDCYDFLGVYTDHKRRWLAEKKLGVNLFIWQNKMKNTPFAVKEIWPTGRYLQPL
ncbi:GNAT family N-acetyltransferase [Psychromonas sp. MME2]|uniref:GNAT family N-acetyltransferase n=1 Tax=unclassified Psychromonas TaxID=2614957 RepID=UPI00339D2861